MDSLVAINVGKILQFIIHISGVSLRIAVAGE